MRTIEKEELSCISGSEQLGYFDYFSLSVLMAGGACSITALFFAILDGLSRPE